MARLIESGLVSRGRDTHHFAHEGIRAAASERLDEHERDQIRLGIGRAQLATRDPSLLDDEAFEIADHLNAAAHLIDDTDERFGLAGLNLICGRRALAAVSYRVAENYFSRGLALLSAGDWKDHYCVTFALNLGAGEAAFLNGDPQTASNRFAEIRTHDITDIDYSIVAERITTLEWTAKNLDASLAAGIDGLDRLGISLSSNPNPLRLVRAFVGAWLSLRGKTADTLAGIPIDTNPAVVARNNLLSSLIVPAYFGDQLLMLEAGLVQIRRSIRGEAGPGTGMGYGTWAALVGHGFGRIGICRELGDLILKLANRDKDPVWVPRLKLVSLFALLPWVQHYREGVAALSDCKRDCLDLGDERYAYYCGLASTSLLFLSGEHLSEVVEQGQHATQDPERIAQGRFRVPSLHAALCLSTPAADTTENHSLIDELRSGTFPDE